MLLEMVKNDHHHDSFAAAVLNPTLPVPEGVARANGGDPQQAFNVYRNNVVASLAEALKASYPVTSQLLGEGLQRALMVDYVRAHPPATPVLTRYGAGFADMLAAHETTRKRPFLAQMARMERLRLDSYHSADAPVLDATALANIDPDALMDGRFVLHPATRLMRSPFPIGSIYAVENAAMAGTLPADGRAGINMAIPEAVLITRPLYDVSVEIIGLGEVAFLHACSKNQPFADAAALGAEKDPDFDLQAVLTLALSTGSFTAFQPLQDAVSMGDAEME